MKLEIQTYKNYESVVRVVDIANKNKFALAIENPKLRDYPVEIRNANTLSLLDWLLNLLGVNDKDGGSDQHIAAFEHVNATLKNYTYQEIKLAFEMYVNGEFTDRQGNAIEVFGELNGRVIGKVMSLYSGTKKENLNLYYQKKQKQNLSLPSISEKQKEDLIINGIAECFEHFKETKEIQSGRIYVYNELYKRNFLPVHDEEFKQRIKNKAQNLASKEHKKEINTMTTKGDIYEAKRLINDFKNGRKNIKAICKKVVLTEFFEKLLQESEDFDIKILLNQ